jgi:hypothetical protein
MGISLLSCGALALVLYFGWALADPKTLKEIEDRFAHRGSSPFGRRRPLWMRNGLGLLAGLTLLAASLYRDLKIEPTEARRPDAAVVRQSPPPAMQDKSLLDRIDDATLQKQIERQQAASRAANP